MCHRLGTNCRKNFWGVLKSLPSVQDNCSVKLLGRFEKFPIGSGQPYVQTFGVYCQRVQGAHAILARLDRSGHQRCHSQETRKREIEREREGEGERERERVTYCMFSSGAFSDLCF